MNMQIDSLDALISSHQVKVRFVLVGIWNTIFGYGMFYLLDNLFSSMFVKDYAAYMSAMLVSNVVSIINAFIFHKYITFRSGVGGIMILVEFFRFCLTNSVTLCLSLALMPVFVEVFRMNTKAAAALVIMVCTVFSYLGHSRFSFMTLSGRNPAGSNVCTRETKYDMFPETQRDKEAGSKMI
jgi:putative flippase GtrA